MSNLEGFILTLLEGTGLMILWSALDSRLSGKYIRKILFTIFFAGVVTMIHFLLNSDGNIIDQIVVLLLICLLFRIPVIDAIFEYIIMIIIIIFLQLIATGIVMLINGNFSYSFGNGVVVNGLFIIETLLIFRYVPIQLGLQIFHMKIKWAGLVTFNTASVIIGMLIIWFFNKPLFLEYYIFIFIVGSAFLIMNIAIVFYGLKVEQQQKIISTHNKYDPIISSLIDEVRRRQHDFKNHLQTIMSLTETVQEEEMKEEIQEYIKCLNHSLKKVDHSIQIENRILAALLYNKKCIAEDAGIEFIYEFNDGIPTYPVENYELTEVIGNLVDNAFEAPMEQENKKKRVVVEMGYMEGGPFVEVKNNGSPIKGTAVRSVFEKGYTTKTGDNHGYGLYNVNSIVRKYKGEILLTRSQEYTIFKVLF